MNHDETIEVIRYSLALVLAVLMFWVDRRFKRKERDAAEELKRTKVLIHSKDKR